MSAKFTPSRASGLRGDGVGSNSIAILFEFDGARFHLWLDEHNRIEPDGVLYKNSPAGLPRSSPLHFEPRKHSLAAGFGRAVVEWITPFLPGLIAQAQDDRVKVEQALRAKREAIAAAERVRDAAPELLRVLKDVAALLPSAARLHSKDLYALQTRVCEAIGKAVQP